MANEKEHQMEQLNICERKAKANKSVAYRKWRTRDLSWPIEERRQKLLEIMLQQQQQNATFVQQQQQLNMAVLQLLAQQKKQYVICIISFL